MPNIIDTQQLQATAQVAKSYILEQDTANIGTIINALQQSGGSTPAPAGKPVPTLFVTDNGDDSGTITYSGDGQLSAFILSHDGINYPCTVSGDTLGINGTCRKDPGYILATETDNFAPNWATFVITGKGPT